MPPLVFDASSPAPPPEPSPEMIQLVREVRVTPDVVFTGRVESASNEPQGPPSPASSSSQDQTRRKGGNFFSKLFHWLGFGHKS